MPESELLTGFFVSLDDLRKGVEYNERIIRGRSGSDVGRAKSPITSAWNRVMSHRYGQAAHDQVCGCGLEPQSQERGTAKNVDLQNLADALETLEHKGAITDTNRQVLEGAVATLFEVLPDIKAEFDAAEAQALDEVG